ncbi:MAG: flippase-like domain-containing protein [Epsilonproteobacteria bacterium]|nr:flippase-like domain-containing protein [Campylobacterota bacterium]
MKNAVKLLITIVMFYFLFQYVDFANLIEILAKSHGGFILIALLFQLGSTFLAAYRWRLIMQLINFSERVSYYVQSYFKGSFFNQVLPSSIGGDAVRIIDLTQKGYDKKEAFYGIFVDRVVGLVGLLVLNFISTLLFFDAFESDFALLILFVSFAGITGFAALFLSEKVEFLGRYKFLDLFHRLARRLNALYGSKTLLTKHIAISVGVHILTILTLYALAWSIDFDMPLEIFFIALPPVFLLTILPISLAGWGIREGAMVGIFMLIGVDSAQVMAMSILYGILLIISAMPGAYFWVKSKKAT